MTTRIPVAELEALLRAIFLRHGCSDHVADLLSEIGIRLVGSKPFLSLQRRCHFAELLREPGENLKGLPVPACLVANPCVDCLLKLLEFHVV